MIKKWNQFIREFVENSNSVVDAKMQELNDLINSISDSEPSQNLIYEWENKNDHELVVNFTNKDVSIRYEFDIDDLYITKFAGETVDFEQPVGSIDEGLDIIEKDIQMILNISEKISNDMKIIKEFKNFNPHPEKQFSYLDGDNSNNDELDREEMEDPLEIVSGFENDELDDMSDDELERMYAALEKDVELKSESFVKSFESSTIDQVLHNKKI